MHNGMCSYVGDHFFINPGIWAFFELGKCITLDKNLAEITNLADNGFRESRILIIAVMFLIGQLSIGQKN